MPLPHLQITPWRWASGAQGQVSHYDPPRSYMEELDGALGESVVFKLSFWECWGLSKDLSWAGRGKTKELGAGSTLYLSLLQPILQTRVPQWFCWGPDVLTSQLGYSSLDLDILPKTQSLADIQSQSTDGRLEPQLPRLQARRYIEPSLHTWD